MSDETLTLDWDAAQKLIPVVVGYIERIRAEEKIDIKEAAAKIGCALGVEDVDGFAQQQLGGILSEGFGQAFDEEGARALAGVFASLAKPMMELVASYAKGEKSAAAFLHALDKLRGDSASQLQGILQGSLGVSDADAQLLSESFGPYLVSIYCFAGAFKIYQSVARDAALAKERSIEIERLSEEAVAWLRAQRAELDGVVDSYMLDRLIPFGSAVSAMDQAILDSDNQGYIAANAQLWDLFGRRSQYRSASEFDDMMLSDDAFRL